MARAILKDGSVRRYRITLDDYCEEYNIYRPYLRRGWDDTEYSLFKKLTAKILNIGENQIERCSV